MVKTEHENIGDRLRNAGSKATPGRIALLEFLEKSKRPLSIPRIAKGLHNTLSPVTLYRALETLAGSGIIRRVDLGHSHAHYEFVMESGHHHHLVCTNCGAIEDIPTCDVEALGKKILKKSKTFVSIKSHSLEFFGLCAVCAHEKK